MKNSLELEEQAALQALALMAAAARTAPKTRGIDNLRIVGIDDAGSRQRLVDKMKEIAQAENRPGFARDAGNIAASPAILLLGVEANTAGLNCGFCGSPTCEALETLGGVCAFNAMDLGIATSSAAGVAATLHIDNRVMFSLGRAAMDLKLFGDRVRQALGVPLSVTGKSPFFDRKP
jgi:uncharacterized ferredoxin-like protein